MKEMEAANGTNSIFKLKNKRAIPWQKSNNTKIHRTIQQYTKNNIEQLKIEIHEPLLNLGLIKDQTCRKNILLFSFFHFYYR